eukprot:229897-Chlamydomonas_euryale.AAC.13
MRPSRLDSSTLRYVGAPMAQGQERDTLVAGRLPVVLAPRSQPPCRRRSCGAPLLHGMALWYGIVQHGALTNRSEARSTSPVNEYSMAPATPCCAASLALRIPLLGRSSSPCAARSGGAPRAVRARCTPGRVPLPRAHAVAGEHEPGCDDGSGGRAATDGLQERLCIKLRGFRFKCDR